jgi:rare lipoprotein A
MKSDLRLWLTLASCCALAGCGSFDGVDDGAAERPEPISQRPAPPGPSGVRDGNPKLGEPFTIDGVTHTPVDVADYDDVGYASWYGSEFGGRPTANGEIFNPGGYSAAHKTLPLPSYVEVTELENGRTILVRVNDRGPMDNSRLIDLSEAAARQLGIADRPTPVRVRRVSPPESERAQLRAGQMVAERLATPESLLTILRTKAAALAPPRGASAVAVPAPRPVAPTPERVSDPAPRDGDRFIVEGEGGSSARPARPTTRPEPVVATPVPLGDYIVQVAAFGAKARADAAARKVGGTVVQAGSVWRVRMGPFRDERAAQAALASARAKGYGEARIMRDR